MIKMYFNGNIMLRNEIFSIALEEIKKVFPDVLGIYVFGSFAKNEETPESDLDIALLLKKPAKALILWEVAEKIAARIQRNVDLIDLISASTVFRFQILSFGKKIDTQNLKYCDSFEDLAWSMYLRLNEERKGILNDIKDRGTIYKK